ncbi:hypothetical protein C8R47DRAFT_185819 [Mycena vitilis]|nr:hypothetical protein C8R47DRAFT_185819 [Mycena vitilis]
MISHDFDALPLWLRLRVFVLVLRLLANLPRILPSPSPSPSSSPSPFASLSSSSLRTRLALSTFRLPPHPFFPIPDSDIFAFDIFALPLVHLFCLSTSPRTLSIVPRAALRCLPFSFFSLLFFSFSTFRLGRAARRFRVLFYWVTVLAGRGARALLSSAASRFYSSLIFEHYSSPFSHFPVLPLFRALLPPLLSSSSPPRPPPLSSSLPFPTSPSPPSRPAR